MCRQSSLSSLVDCFLFTIMQHCNTLSNEYSKYGSFKIFGRQQNQLHLFFVSEFKVGYRLLWVCHEWSILHFRTFHRLNKQHILSLYAFLKSILFRFLFLCASSRVTFWQIASDRQWITVYYRSLILHHKILNTICTIHYYANR